MEDINFNDDDLFDYDPENEIEDNNVIDNISNSSQTKTQPTNDYVSAVKETLKNTEIDIDDTGLNKACIKIARAFHDGTNHWIYGVNELDPYFKSLKYTLDIITDNDFSKIELFYYTEHILGRKILADFLMREVFCLDGKEDKGSGIKTVMREMFEIEVSDFFMNIIYNNIYKLNKLSIDIDKLLYIQLGSALNLPLIDELLQDDPDLIQLHKAINYHQQFNQANQKIINDLFTKEVMEAHGLKLVIHQEDEKEAEADS